jgi:uncharacterized membrane protein
MTSLFSMTSAPIILAAFLASLVEFVEALTIVLAVGTVRGWAPALLGAVLGTVLLVLLVAALGPLLGDIPLNLLQLVVGILLLLFGLRWLRKAILRSAGIIALHDETAAFAKQTSALQAGKPMQAALADPLAIVTTFKAVVLEGVEVVFIVIAVGSAGGQLVPASIGALAAGLLVLVLGFAVHRPLARVPENMLKFTVGILLSAFGTFWLSEGLGFTPPGEDLSILVFAVLLMLFSVAGVKMARRRVE